MSVHKSHLIETKSIIDKFWKIEALYVKSIEISNLPNRTKF